MPPDEAEAAELEAMSLLFEQQMQSPVYSMARGPLLQLLLIQTQYMRRELLVQVVGARVGALGQSRVISRRSRGISGKPRVIARADGRDGHPHGTKLAHRDDVGDAAGRRSPRGRSHDGARRSTSPTRYPNPMT